MSSAAPATPSGTGDGMAGTTRGPGPEWKREYGSGLAIVTLLSNIMGIGVPRLPLFPWLPATGVLSGMGEKPFMVASRLSASAPLAGLPLASLSLSLGAVTGVAGMGEKPCSA